MTRNHKQQPFDDCDLVFSYSRKEAIVDGVLIDVTETAREAGFRYPVALTAALWSDVNAIPESVKWQDVTGRLWDILWMGVNAIRGSADGSTELLFGLD